MQTFKQTILKLEEVVLDMQIVNATLNAVYLQLVEDLDPDNAAILNGISGQLSKAYKAAEDLFNFGCEIMHQQ